PMSAVQSVAELSVEKSQRGLAGGRVSGEEGGSGEAVRERGVVVVEPGGGFGEKRTGSGQELREGIIGSGFPQGLETAAAGVEFVEERAEPAPAVRERGRVVLGFRREHRSEEMGQGGPVLRGEGHGQETGVGVRPGGFREEPEVRQGGTERGGGEEGT